MNNLIQQMTDYNRQNRSDKFTISEIRPRIFLLKFKSQYEMCMHFVRYQEFYECPSSKFRGQPFELLDYQAWWAKEYGNGCFDYPIRWSGFNLPGRIIKQVWDLGIIDRNRYDNWMWGTYLQLSEQYPDDNFYVIGAVSGNQTTIKHELSHGFYYTMPEYKKQVLLLVKQLPKPIYKSMCQTLKKLGYTKQVFDDECQAYLSTGLAECFKPECKDRGLRKPFMEIFSATYKATAKTQ